MSSIDLTLAEESGSCKLYTGESCARSNYFIPASKTQTEIDKSIVSLHENGKPYKEDLCSHLVRNALCSLKYRKCVTQEEKEPLVLPLCKASCKKLQKSLCVTSLDHDSQLGRWFHNNLKCNERNDMDYAKENATSEEKKCHNSLRIPSKLYIRKHVKLIMTSLVSNLE